jgi:hypothetical protein
MVIKLGVLLATHALLCEAAHVSYMVLLLLLLLLLLSYCLGLLLH